MSVTSSPRAATPAAKDRDRAGDDSRMSCPTTIEVAPSGRATTRANAEPMAKATASFNCCGTRPRTSYALINSDSLGALTRHSLSITQDAQVAAAACLDGAAQLSLGSPNHSGHGAGGLT